MFDLNAWDWLGIGLIFLVLELVISGVFLFWIGLAAITLSIILLVAPALSWQVQLVIFGITTLGYVLGWSYFGRSRFAAEEQDHSKNLNSRTMNYIGQVRPLSEPIVGGKGIVIIDDSRWVVRGPELEKGTFVKITAVKGSELDVVTASPSDQP